MPAENLRNYDQPTTTGPDVTEPRLERRCASCNSSKIRRSHRDGLIELVQSVFGHYPFCCHECKGRFFLKYETVSEESQASDVKLSHDRPIERRREQKRIETRRKQRIIVLTAICLLLFFLFLKFYVLSPPPIVMDE